MKIGVTVMRLQPLHKGHKKIIDKMLQENEKNPYSFKERLHMVNTLYKEQINNGSLIVQGINDIHNPPQWANYIKTHLPLPANRYYCGTGQDAPLFKKEGFIPVIINRQELNISGTQIRLKLKNNDQSWKQDIPAQIHHLI